MKQATEPIRRTLLFTGRVQGVGFRYATCYLARAHEVTGFVKNLPDGRVQAVIEGPKHEVERFEAAILAEMKPYIQEVSRDEAVASGEYRAFGIEH